VCFFCALHFLKTSIKLFFFMSKPYVIESAKTGLIAYDSKFDCIPQTQKLDEYTIKYYGHRQPEDLLFLAVFFSSTVVSRTNSLWP